MAGGRDPFAGRYTYTGTRPYTAVLPTFTQLAPAPTPVPPIVTGIEPETYNAILYGKDRPLFVAGDAPIGGRPIEGVFWSGTQDDPRVSFIAYHAEAAAPALTREIRGVRLRGKEVTHDGSIVAGTQGRGGGGLLTSPEFAGTGARVEFRTGATDQVPCQQSVLRYGAGAVGYINGILSSWENIPVRLFGGIVPMPTVRVWQGDETTLTDALAILLRYARYADADFEVSVARSYSAVIVPSKTGLIEFLQRLRALLVRMNINYHDKMRIIEPEGFAVAVEITHSNTIADTIRFTKLDPLVIPREKIAGFINQDRDHEFDHVRAREDLYPVATTASIESESFELALVTTAEQMLADIHVSLFEEAAAKSQLSATLMAGQFGAEPGDGARYADDPDALLLGNVSEVDQNFEDFTAAVTVLEGLNCGAELDDVVAAVEFGGDSAIILPASDVADSPYLSGVTFFNLPSDADLPGSTLFEFTDETTETAVVISVSGPNLRVVVILADTDGLQRSWIPSDGPTTITNDTWHSLAVAVDVSPADIDDKIVTVVLDGAVITMVPTGFVLGTTLALDGIKVAVPSAFLTLSGSPVRMSRTQIWAGQYIDWADADNLAKVIDGDNAPVGAAAAAAEFGAPTYLFDGGADTFAPAGFALTGTLDDFTPVPP